MAPAADANTPSGKRGPTRRMLTFPDVKYDVKLVTADMVPANLFVPKAKDGGSPTNKRAGSEMRPPPPTVASMKAATKPETARVMTVMSDRCTV
ncbi:hypothetical protein Alches_22760 [Alicyclobacillus hesperidum subsp. aegles]|nr:hypothetical protein Alches_22760 [Alicyclobacillus hesperidum subsp. aegles]